MTSTSAWPRSWPRCRVCPCSGTARSRASASSTAWSSAGRSATRRPERGPRGAPSARDLPAAAAALALRGLAGLPPAQRPPTTAARSPTSSPTRTVPSTGPVDAGERRSLVVYLNRYPRADVRVAGVAEALGLRRRSGGLPHPARPAQRPRVPAPARATCASAGSSCRSTATPATSSWASRRSPTPMAAGWAELARRIGLARRGGRASRAASAGARRSPARGGRRHSSRPRTVEEAFLPVPRQPRPRHARPDGRCRRAADLMLAIGRLADARRVRRDDRPKLLADDWLGRRDCAHVSRPRLGCSLRRSLPRGRSSSPSAELRLRCATRSAPSRAFDAWDGAAAVVATWPRRAAGTRTAWRVVELARALLACRPARLARPPRTTGLPGAWFEIAACAPPTGWNDGRARVYLAEAWVELVGCRSPRVTRSWAWVARESAAAELKRRAAASGYRIDAADIADGDRVADAAVSRRSPRATSSRTSPPAGAARASWPGARTWPGSAWPGIAESVYWGRPVPGFGDPARAAPARRPGAGGPRRQPHRPRLHGRQPGWLRRAALRGAPPRRLLAATALRRRWRRPAAGRRLHRRGQPLRTAGQQADHRRSATPACRTSSASCVCCAVVRVILALGALRLGRRCCASSQQRATALARARASATAQRRAWAPTPCWAATTRASRTPSRAASPSACWTDVLRHARELTEAR